MRFLALFFCLLLTSSWQVAFVEKVAKGERPHWMIHQIQKDLAPFAKKGISQTDLRAVEALDSSLQRFRIANNHILVKKNFRNEEMAKCLLELATLVGLPDVEFILSFNDSFYHVAGLNSCQGPLFSFAKRQGDQGIILMPDPLVLKNAPKLLEAAKKGSQEHPWNEKADQAFWRGVNSGFLPGSLAFMNVDNFLKYPRCQLVTLSLNHPDHVDAGFNSLPHTSQELNALLVSLGYCREFVSIEDALRFKYQIWVDGYTCPFERAYWELFSNSLIFKHDSRDMQWYHAQLRPYVHFVPVAADFSDLLQKIDWAKRHDDVAMQITQNANRFAETHLLYEDVMLYLYLLLVEYSKLLVP